MCDHGRFLSESLNARDIHKASIREGSDVKDAIVPVAIERAAREIRAVIEKTGPTGLFFLGSAHLSNEENFLLAQARRPPRLPQPRRGRGQVAPAQDQVEDRVGRGRRRRAELPGARDMGLSPAKNGFGLDAVLAGKATPEAIVISDAGFAALADDPERSPPSARRASSWSPRATGTR